MGYESSAGEFFGFMSLVMGGACFLAFFGSGVLWDYLQRRTFRPKKTDGDRQRMATLSPSQRKIVNGPGSRLR